MESITISFYYTGVLRSATVRRLSSENYSYLVTWNDPELRQRFGKSAIANPHTLILLIMTSLPDDLEELHQEIWDAIVLNHAKFYY